MKYSFADPAGLNFGGSPEQTALGAGGNGFPPPDPIHYCLGIEELPGLLIFEDSFKLSEFLFGRAKPGHLHRAVGPVHKGEDRIHNDIRYSNEVLKCKPKGT